MSGATAIELLEPFRSRLLRRFVVTSSRPECDALFDLVYDEVTTVTSETARAVDRELHVTEKTVGDLIDGWRPRALGEVVPS